MTFFNKVGSILLFLYFSITINFSYRIDQQDRYYYIISSILIGFFILYFSLNYIHKYKVYIKSYKPINFYFYLFVYSVFSYYLLSLGQDNTLIINFLKVFTIFIITFYYVDSRNKLLTVLFSLMFSGVSMYFFNKNLIDNTSSDIALGLVVKRVAGNLSNSNTIAMVAVASLWSIILLFFYYKNKILKVLFLVSAALPLYLILLSGSRKGLIAIILLAFLILIFHILHLSSKNRFTKIFLIFVGFLCFFYFTKKVVIDSYYGHKLMSLIELDYKYNSDIERMSFAKASIKMWSESPIWGKGFNNFTSLGANYNVTPNTYSHSTLWELLANMGLVGVLLYFGMFYLIYNQSRICLKHSNDIKDVIILRFIKIFLIILVMFNLFAVIYTHKVFIPLLAAFSGYIYSVKQKLNLIVKS